MLLITVTFAFSACTSTTAGIVTNIQTITPTMTQTITTQQVDDEETIYPTPVSDEQILAQVNKIIRGLGLDVNPDLDFTALVENGVVTLDGTVLYPDEESLIQSVGSIQGVVKIRSNYDFLAE
jgi:osmotically-inducible protein OsmY